jgi:hypothetical protein
MSADGPEQREAERIENASRDEKRLILDEERADAEADNALVAAERGAAAIHQSIVSVARATLNLMSIVELTQREYAIAEQIYDLVSKLEDDRVDARRRRYSLVTTL